MSSFFYFVPRVANAADYVDLGLGYAFDGPPAVTLLRRGEGPQQLEGSVLHNWGGDDLPRDIEWRQTESELWLGWCPRAIPGPLQLRNTAEITAGVQVRLRDGNLWTVPRVIACRERDPERRDGLSRIYASGPIAHQPELRIPPEYGPLLESATAYLRAFLEDRIAELPTGVTLQLAADLLAVGHRISLRELLALELLEQRSTEIICLDAIDALEWVKCDQSARIVALLDQMNVGTWMELIAFKVARQQVEEEGTEGRGDGGT